MNFHSLTFLVSEILQIDPDLLTILANPPKHPQEVVELLQPSVVTYSASNFDPGSGNGKSKSPIKIHQNLSGKSSHSEEITIFNIL